MQSFFENFNLNIRGINMEFILEKLSSINFLTLFIGLMLKIGYIICIYILGKILIKILNYIVLKSLRASTKISERKKETIINILKSCIKYSIYILIFSNILTTIGINIVSLVTIAGVGSVAIGLGAQSIIQDILTGAFILFEDQFGIGDIVSIGSFTGTVETITLRTTNIRSIDGDLYIIPNGQISSITNMSKGFNRASVTICISYEENIDRVIKIMEKELKTLFENKLIKGLISCPKVLGVVELAESSVNIKIIADTQVGENWQVEREIRKYIKNSLDKENISIPYPKRVVEIIQKKDAK